jgi:phosphoribosylaminoimidazolecarboxamide formyltransferase/IMP cyclohydrolase
MPTALLSLFDKTGVEDLAGELVALKWDLVSTGGTAKALRAAGFPVRDVESLTKFPEMLDGRVKTLHPVVHGGLLARRDLPEHMAAIAEHGIGTIDLVAVNLYPFRETAARAGATFEDVVEQIDSGGPSMLRSAAKNHQSVWALVDPSDYASVLAPQAGGAGSGRNSRQSARALGKAARRDPARRAEMAGRPEGPGSAVVKSEKNPALRLPVVHQCLLALEGTNQRSRFCA